MNPNQDAELFGPLLAQLQEASLSAPPPLRMRGGHETLPTGEENEEDEEGDGEEGGEGEEDRGGEGDTGDMGWDRCKIS
ncbi:hypothetical protein FRC08_004507 [Ceratobasidium sp. 394]|nr:hypothetical protein FRC08_004507 [Ceratobasidium sp. 394]KAG9090192.1 hypothetical protein FS749_000748 [Ceratobasidium sp. UAMH 11750]